MSELQEAVAYIMSQANITAKVGIVLGSGIIT